MNPFEIPSQFLMHLNSGGPFRTANVSILSRESMMNGEIAGPVCLRKGIELASLNLLSEDQTS